MNTPEQRPGSLLGWLGLGNSRRGGNGGDAPAGADGHGKNGAVRQARRILLDEITDFIVEHDLQVTPANLLIAHGVFSGANPGLARQISSRTQAGDAIDQQWLDEASANDDSDYDADGFDLLMTRLESTLSAFSTSTKAARSATSQYNEELEQHVAELDSVQDSDQIVSHLAVLTRAMLDRTRKVEHEMRRSEDEAKALRSNLEKAKRDAEVDHLTGLPNRRAFEALLEQHYREAQAAIESLCVAFCDIDHFKRVNDTHGHAAGDRVIKVIGESLSRITDDNCHVARHGGEEFVMLFRNVPLAEARERLDQVRETLAAREIINRDSDEPFGQITFSGGVADVFAYPDPRHALKAADDALYRAKENGRNQISVADS
ncbi:MAG: GGDEF domain-containing protein [Novosphingobium sp.]|nr:GGDEF domain-containing protein [Novosphingobium sp.]MCP5401142.1 GGDEF domain-containing protein [Novosphingobium sp.]